jgi:hypothetical protein
MAIGGPASKNLRYGDLACPHAGRAKLPAQLGPGNRQLRQAIRCAGREFGAPDSHRANPIPVCSHGNS